MKPLSQEAVKRLALSHGAKLQIDGKNVNAARLQVVTKAPAPAAKEEPDQRYMQSVTKPEPLGTIEPDPAVREAVVSIDNYAASQFLINESNQQLMQQIQAMLNKPTPAATAPEKRPTQWVFKVKRDAQGLMETITATAKFMES